MSSVPSVATGDKPPAKRLIVNADDFGWLPEVNRRVLAAHRDGILTSASLAVTAGAAAEAATLAQQNASLGVGLHIVLVGDAPVLPAREVLSLVDGQGRLPAKPAALADARPEEILDEMRAQHRRFRQLVARSPTHLDAKDDAHLQRPVFDALVTLAWELGLPVRGVTPAMRLRLRREDLWTADHFLELPALGGSDALVDLLMGIEDGVTELRCRPERASQEPAGTVESPGPQGWSALTDPGARATIAAQGIQLVHFGQL
jgi:predicted glycoside hydrolase/deacetylase ChbG (UPF0249 family)